MYIRCKGNIAKKVLAKEATLILKICFAIKNNKTQVIVSKKLVLILSQTLKIRKLNNIG